MVFIQVFQFRQRGQVIKRFKIEIIQELWGGTIQAWLTRNILMSKGLNPFSFLQGFNNIGTPASFSSTQVSFWFAGRGISQILHQKIAEACEDFLDYFNEYNTREVGNEAFRNEIRNYEE